MTIVSHGSAQGLSLLSYLIETLSYTITLAYNIRQDNPFSTFGEILFITLQNMIIASLILSYSKQTLLVLPLLALFGAVFYGLQQPDMIAGSGMATLYAATIPLSLASKVPQIWTNFRNKSTGQLSVFTVMNYFLGSAARVFTTYAELDDPLMLLGTLLATGLNLLLVLQVFLYWGKATAVAKKSD
jgi:mannose-P-dolichol utilization defect protein 1